MSGGFGESVLVIRMRVWKDLKFIVCSQLDKIEEKIESVGSVAKHESNWTPS